ncbi:MAG: hypothetical protein U1F16_08545 [Turneriella sp.]
MKRVMLLLLAILPLAAAPKAEQFSGTVLAVDEDYCSHTADYLVRMTLTTTTGVNVTLVLAPKWYLHKNKIEFRTGDKIETTVQRQSDGTLHVITIKTGGKTIRIRSDAGRPLWKPEPGSEDLFKSLCKA